MFHKIKSVRALTDGRLCVHFAEGVSKIYDMKKVYSTIAAFKALQRDERLFRSVEVDVGGYGISWNDDIDLSCDELWDKGVQVESPFDGLISLGDATELWNLNESTLRKAIAYGKLIPGVDVCKFGKQWVISADSMRREYGEPKAM